MRRRYGPAGVRRAVWERDRGQCTFVGSDGKRCQARRFLEFDHIMPVARGGRASVQGMRLRCRAHNQYDADRSFGAHFMAKKREGVPVDSRNSGLTEAGEALPAGAQPTGDKRPRQLAPPGP